MNKFDLNNKNAIITGGAQGFGLDIAKRFLQSGAKVILWDSDEKELKKVLKLINDQNLSCNVVDVSDSKSVDDTVNKITSKTKIDILINNAGITGSTAELWNYDYEEWKKYEEGEIDEPDWVHDLDFDLVRDKCGSDDYDFELIEDE